MKKLIIGISLLFLDNLYCQINQKEVQKFLNYIPENFEIDTLVSGKFDNDKLLDYLLILSHKEERESYLLDNRDLLTKRKVIILKGLTNRKYLKVFDNDNVVPCRECGGKSDNLYSSLSIKNRIFIYKTCEAPFAQESYKIKKYELELINNNFRIISYHEEYYKSPEEDEEIIINFAKEEIGGKNYYPFNYFKWDWTSDDDIIINKNNVMKINDFAYSLYKSKNYNYSISLLENIISKFPKRIVAYLNIADCYWETNEKEKAKENYKKYIQLMKDQKKDLKRIPKYILERIK